MFTLFIAFATLSFNALAANEQLQTYCQEVGGKTVSRLTCHASLKARKGPFCLIDSGKNAQVFFNGCTKSLFGYGNVFFHACVKHDLCYHHEPATSGLKKSECDNQFYRNMMKICSTQRHQTTCSAMAAVFYRGVQSFGDKSFKCSNNKYDYEAFLRGSLLLD